MNRLDKCVSCDGTTCRHTHQGTRRPGLPSQHPFCRCQKGRPESSVAGQAQDLTQPGPLKLWRAEDTPRVLTWTLSPGSWEQNPLLPGGHSPVILGRVDVIRGQDVERQDVRVNQGFISFWCVSDSTYRKGHSPVISQEDTQVLGPCLDRHAGILRPRQGTDSPWAHRSTRQRGRGSVSANPGRRHSAYHPALRPSTISVSTLSAINKSLSPHRSLLHPTERF